MSFYNCRADFPLTRLRRPRMHAFSRLLAREHCLQVADCVCPLFVLTGKKMKVAIPNLPGHYRMSLDVLLEEAEVLLRLGIQAIALFPVVDAEQQSIDARAAYDDNGLMPTVIRALKSRFPELGIISDIALDPYTPHGHDGLLSDDGEVLNDATLTVLNRQALCHAAAGCDILAPSDMMDGRIGTIRQALEANQHHNTMILAYSAKYASSLYGPFRDAIATTQRLGQFSKASYQLSAHNSDEALHEVACDLKEGADIVMIKPAMYYLDVIQRVKQHFHCPTWAYQVSGEYTMLKAAVRHHSLPATASMLESLIACKRAGADVIITYFAKELATYAQHNHLNLT